MIHLYMEGAGRSMPDTQAGALDEGMVAALFPSGSSQEAGRDAPIPAAAPGNNHPQEVGIHPNG